MEPIEPMQKVSAEIGIAVDLYGLRRSFFMLFDWIKTPVGIAPQIQGHKPSGVREFITSVDRSTCCAYGI